MVLDFSGSVNSSSSNQVPLNSEQANSDLKLKVDTKGQFSLNISDGDDLLITTKNQTFLMMSHYQEIGFRVKSRKFFGLGERVSSYFLK